MKHLRKALGGLAALVLSFMAATHPAMASNCPTYPYTLSNGTTADANQVMANFNSILNCGNSNLAKNGVNSDITNLLGIQSITLPASTISSAALTLTQGATPGAPANGNIWTTSTGVFAQISGTTLQLASVAGTVSSWNARAGAVTLQQSDILAVGAFLSSGGTLSGSLGLVQGTTTVYPERFTAGTNLTSPLSGVVEFNGSNWFGTDSTPTRHTFAFLDSPSITGTSAGWTTSRTESFTGDATGGPTSVNGSANWSTALTIASGAVTNAKMANMSAATIKANVTGGSAAPTDVAISSLQGTTSSTFAAGNDSRFGGTPQNAQAGNYTLVAGDAGGQVIHFSASTHTYTIPANGSVPYPIGTKIDIVNGCSGGTLNIAITTDTLTWLPSGSTGSRALSSCAEATLSKVTSTVWYIVGTGVSLNVFKIPAPLLPANDNELYEPERMYG